MSQISPDLLKYLVPICELSSSERVHLSRLVKVKNLNMGDKILARDFVDYFVYLLEGRLDLCDEYVEPLLIDSDDEQSQHSLFKGSSEQSSMVANTACLIMFVEREEFNLLMNDDLVLEGKQLIADISYIETNIYNEILQAIEADQLTLPSLPEVAYKIQQEMASEEVNIDDIVRIVKSDPAIAIRLMQVANSVLTRGLEPVKSIHSAIVRLGLEMTQNLVVSLSINQLFETDQQILKKRMKQMYKHSVEISAISFALSRKLKCFDADQLLLAGLIHDIGVIPILTYIDQTGLEIHSEKEVDSVVARLRAAVGSLVVKSWGFSEDMVTVVEQAENWFKNDSAEIEMADIVIVAQIYNLLRHKQLDDLPEIKKIPLLKKMFKQEPDPDFVMEVFEDAQQVIDEVTQIFSV